MNRTLPSLVLGASPLALVPVQLTAAQGTSPGGARLTEAQARAALDSIYRGDYRAAFVERRPELFLRHIPDDFQSTSVEGNRFGAAALRQFFPTQFRNMVRTLEHNVTVEDVDVLAGGRVSAVVTLHTLIEFRGAGGGTSLVNTVGTYRDNWQNRGGTWFEVRGDQPRNSVTTAPRP